MLLNVWTLGRGTGKREGAGRGSILLIYLLHCSNVLLYIYICLYTYIFVNIYMQRQLILNLTIACELFQTHKLLIQPVVIIHHVLRA